MLRTTGCMDCGYDRCMCYSASCGECGLPVDPLGRSGCQCHHRRAARVSPDALVPLGSVAPLAAAGLMIEGIATTRDWNSIEVPLAAGLKRLDGSTTRRRSGLDPRKMQVTLPLPLLWRHEWDKPLGEMFAASATETAVHFRACIAPPGTPNYDGDLLARVWADVRSGAAPAVSFASQLPEEDGSWRGKELSVCPVGGNPYAIITRASFPDGHVTTRSAPKFDRADAQRAWLGFEAAHNQHRRRETTAQTKGIGIGPRSGIRRYIDCALVDMLGVRMSGGVSLLASVAASRAAASAFTGADGIKAQELIDSAIERAVDASLNPGTVVPDDGLDAVMVEAFGPEVSASLRSYVLTRVPKIREYEAAQQDRRASVASTSARGDPLFYSGVWEANTTYSRGVAVTHDGTMWFCQTDDTKDRPGTSHAWRMMVKSVRTSNKQWDQNKPDAAQNESARE